MERPVEAEAGSLKAGQQWAFAPATVGQDERAPQAREGADQRGQKFHASLAARESRDEARWAKPIRAWSLSSAIKPPERAAHPVGLRAGEARSRHALALVSFSRTGPSAESAAVGEACGRLGTRRRRPDTGMGSSGPGRDEQRPPREDRIARATCSSSRRAGESISAGSASKSRKESSTRKLSAAPGAFGAAGPDARQNRNRGSASDNASMTRLGGGGGGGPGSSGGG